MPSNALPALPPRSRQRLHDLLQDGQRKLLGLVGPPGAGKSTLALAIQREFGEAVQRVPMDGFHLAQCELQRLGRAGRKGAPDTFDADGYVALLQRLRAPRQDEIVYAPEFRREIEEPIAGAIAVDPQTRLVITEGNYLLLDRAPWASVFPLLDDVWYLDVEDGLRNQRLTRRHEEFGKTTEEATGWVAATDEPNARLVASHRARAKFFFRWNEG